MPLLFLKTGWMIRYKGSKGDPVFSTMSYVKEFARGHERNNFKAQHGRCFGYAPVSGVDIERHFGADPGAKYIDGIDVVWASNRPRPLGGLVIVGWYRNARVYRHQLPAPSLIIAEAKASDCKLLPVEERLYELPLSGRGAFRTATLWYAERFPKIVRDVEAMLAGTYRYEPGMIRTAKKADPDITQRTEVERAAIEHVTRHYLDLGFDVESVESEDRGWDLFARGHNLTLRLEVKGTAHQQIMPLLTPNEFVALHKHRKSYRLCIVCRALEKERTLTNLHNMLRCRTPGSATMAAIGK